MLLILAVAVMSDSSGLMVTVSVAQGVCGGMGVRGAGINLYNSVQKPELWSTDLTAALQRPGIGPWQTSSHLLILEGSDQRAHGGVA